jgi:hypothetical protein
MVTPTMNIYTDSFIVFALFSSITLCSWIVFETIKHGEYFDYDDY